MANILSDIQGALSNWYRDKTQMAMSGGEGFGNEWEDYQGFEPRVTPNSSLEQAVNQPGSWNTEPVHRAPNSWFSPEGMAENTIPGGFLYNAPGEESQLPIFPGMAQSYLNTQRHMSDPYYKTTAKEDLANIGNLNVPVVSDIADVGNLGWMAKDFIGDPSAEEAMAMGMMPFIGMARGKHVTPHRWAPEPVTDAKGVQKYNPDGSPALSYDFDFTFGGKGQGAAIHGKGEYGLQSKVVEDHYIAEFSRHPDFLKRIGVLQPQLTFNATDVSDQDVLGMNDVEEGVYYTIRERLEEQIDYDSLMHQTTQSMQELDALVDQAINDVREVFSYEYSGDELDMYNSAIDAIAPKFSVYQEGIEKLSEDPVIKYMGNALPADPFADDSIARGHGEFGPDVFNSITNKLSSTTSTDNPEQAMDELGYEWNNAIDAANSTRRNIPQMDQMYRNSTFENFLHEYPDLFPDSTLRNLDTRPADADEIDDMSEEIVAYNQEKIDSLATFYKDDFSIEKGFVPKPDIFEVSHPDQAINQMLNQDLTMAEQNPHILDLIAANPPVVDKPGALIGAKTAGEPVTLAQMQSDPEAFDDTHNRIMEAYEKKYNELADDGITDMPFEDIFDKALQSAKDKLNSSIFTQGTQYGDFSLIPGLKNQLDDLSYAYAEDYAFDLPGGKKEMFETGKASPLITNADGKSSDDLVPQSGSISSTTSDEYMEAQIMESFTQDYNTQVEMAKELGNDPSLIDKREIIEDQLAYVEEMLTEELAEYYKPKPGAVSIDENYGNDLRDQLMSLRKLDIDSFKFPEQTAPSDVVTPEQILARYGETEGHEFRADLNRFFDPDDPRDSGPTQTKDYLDSIGIPGSFTYEGGLRGGWGDYGDLNTGDEAPKIFVSHNPDAAYHYGYKGEDPFDQEKFDNLLKQEEKYKKMTNEYGYPPWTRYKK